MGDTKKKDKRERERGKEKRNRKKGDREKRYKKCSLPLSSHLPFFPDPPTLHDHLSSPPVSSPYPPTPPPPSPFLDPTLCLLSSPPRHRLFSHPLFSHLLLLSFLSFHLLFLLLSLLASFVFCFVLQVVLLRHRWEGGKELKL